MPKKITRVRWSTQNLPYGLDISGTTGVITGTPEDVGEYTVPVTVETNYGKDTKNVTIVVEPPTYGVYAIGSKAATWAEGGEPDADGFYVLNMPKANKLVAHYEGFGAITADKKYYCCGVYDFTTVSAILNKLDPPRFISVTKPTVFIESATGITRVIFGSYYNYYSSGGTTRITQKKWRVYWVEKTGKGYGSHSGVLVNTTVSGQSAATVSSTANPGFLAVDTVGDDMAVFGDATLQSGMDISYLRSTGFLVQLTGNTASGTVRKLEEKAKKLCYPMTPFLCLTESGFLYNTTASALISCSYGAIKNVWGNGAAAFYVQTEGDFLCQYNSSTQDWDLLGTYDIKKLEVPDTKNVFMLTNDGELYHKGNQISGVTEAHDTLTRIFPDMTFKDFTFGGNTLTVLRE